MAEQEKKKFYDSLKWPLIFIAIIWGVHILKIILKTNFGIDLAYWGVFPRKIYGLKGILTSPLIHEGWRHLFSNSVPLLGLGLVIGQETVVGQNSVDADAALFASDQWRVEKPHGSKEQAGSTAVGKVAVAH